MAGRANESSERPKLLIPQCREFSRSINDAIDRRTEVMYKEAGLTKRWMASFFSMPESAVTDREFEEFKVFFQLALQQLIVAAIQRFKREKKPYFDKTIVAAIESGELKVFSGTEVYHDVMHVVMARLLSKGGRDVTTLRPNYLKNPNGVHVTIGREGKRELDLIEERIVDFFYDKRDRVGSDFREIKNKFKDGRDQLLELIRRIFRTSGEIDRVRSMPRVMAFLSRMLSEWESNPRAFYDEFKKLMQGLL